MAHGPRSAQAQDSPTGIMKLQQATKGSETVATKGFEGAGAKPDEASSKDATELKISAGGGVGQRGSLSSPATRPGPGFVRPAADHPSLPPARHNHPTAGQP